jgi:hypothetical protein
VVATTGRNSGRDRLAILDAEQGPGPSDAQGRHLRRRMPRQRSAAARIQPPAVGGERDVRHWRRCSTRRVGARQWLMAGRRRTDRPFAPDRCDERRTGHKLRQRSRFTQIIRERTAEWRTVRMTGDGTPIAMTNRHATGVSSDTSVIWQIFQDPRHWFSDPPAVRAIHRPWGRARTPRWDGREAPCLVRRDPGGKVAAPDGARARPIAQRAPAGAVGARRRQRDGSILRGDCSSTARASAIRGGSESRSRRHAHRARSAPADRRRASLGRASRAPLESRHHAAGSRAGRGGPRRVVSRAQPRSSGTPRLGTRLTAETKCFGAEATHAGRGPRHSSSRSVFRTFGLVAKDDFVRHASPRDFFYPTVRRAATPP